MPSKQQIIDYVSDYSNAQLADYIRQGILTFDELCESEDFSRPNRIEVRTLLERRQHEAPDVTNSGAIDPDDDQAAFDRACAAGTREALRSFIRQFPFSALTAPARERLRQLPEDDDTVTSFSSTVNPVPVEEPVETVRHNTPPRQTSAWDAVDKSSIDAIKDFIRKHPGDPNLAEARQLIRQLRERTGASGFTARRDIVTLMRSISNIQTDKKISNPNEVIHDEIVDYLNSNDITVDDLLNAIRDDHNLVHSAVIKTLVEEAYIFEDDLDALGIDPRFNAFLAEDQDDVAFEEPEKLEKINKVSTEVYFWGIPSSGKTCALGAILSVANSGKVARSMRKDNDCQGYGYMTRLSEVFRDTTSVGALPPGTPLISTFEMGFDLIDEKGREHPITCIDLAGELIRVMYKNDAREPLTDKEVEVLDTVTRLLIDNRSVNRKVHFFVLEYGGENRQYEGLRQADYLDAALRYIERTGIFDKDTDAIYLLFTKVDKARVTGQLLIDELTDYTNRNYRGFYQGLEHICSKHEINGGRVERIPFTLGEVCYQNYCLFDSRAAENVVIKLLERTKGFETGKRGKLMSIFKK